jgi:hypothetical protein
MFNHKSLNSLILGDGSLKSIIFVLRLLYDGYGFCEGSFDLDVEKIK